MTKPCGELCLWRSFQQMYKLSRMDWVNFVFGGFEYHSFEVGP